MKENRINIKQVNQEIIKSITNRKKSTNKSLKKENKCINKMNKSKTKSKNNLNVYLLDTLEMNKNRFNKNGNIIQKDPSISNKENLNINNIKTNIQSKEIKFNDDKFKIHANIYNNQYETTKLLSTTEEKYSLNELINDFQNPKESPELNKLNNNFSNNKNNSNDKNSNSKNDKNVGTPAFQIYYNKNIRNSIKEDNYLSDSDDEKNSINKKEEEKSENEDDIEEEMVKTILNDVPDSCLKNNNDKLNSLFIERTKKDFF